MAKNKSSDDDNDPLIIIKLLLNSKYERAKAEGITLWPDDAMREVSKLMDREINRKVDKKLSDNSGSDVQPQFNRINEFALAHKAHHYAVDLFYKFYFPTIQGAPRISDADLAIILRLNEGGKSPREIALFLEPNLKTPLEIKQAKEKIRKRIESAKKKNL